MTSYWRQFSWDKIFFTFWQFSKIDSFLGTDQKTTTAAPKIKIKDVKPEETKSPKIVIKNIGEPSKNKAVLKQPELFGDPKHLDRPKSSASGEIPITNEPKIKIKKDKKSKDDHEKKRNASGK